MIYYILYVIIEYLYSTMLSSIKLVIILLLMINVQSDQKCILKNYANCLLVQYYFHYFIKIIINEHKNTFVSFIFSIDNSNNSIYIVINDNINTILFMYSVNSINKHICIICLIQSPLSNKRKML